LYTNETGDENYKKINFLRFEGEDLGYYLLGYDAM